MSFKSLFAAGAAMGLLAAPATALAEPLFPSLVLAPLSAADKAEIAPQVDQRADAGFDAGLTPAFIPVGGLDIVEDPLYAAETDWRPAPGARRSIAEMRESFETGDTPQITITRFSTQ